MPRMYLPSDVIDRDMSLEAFAGYYQQASVVSLESVDRYLAKVKDTLHTAKKLFTSNEDQFVQETLNERFEIHVLSKKVPYQQFRVASVSRPEGFSGLYVNYLQELEEIAKKTLESVTSSLEHLKISVASFINNHHEGQIDTLYGLHYFVQERKVIDQLKKQNSKFFKAAQNKTKTTAQEVIRAMTDFEQIYPLIDGVALSLNQPNAKTIEKKVRDVTELIDALVDQNLKTGILVKSEGAKKELMTAIDQAARAVEFYTALHAEFFACCSAFKTLTEALKKAA